MVLNVFSVPHRHAVDRPQLLSDGEDVQQSLSGMFPDSVSSVDHWLTAVTRRTLEIRVTGRHLNDIDRFKSKSLRLLQQCK